MTVIAAYADGTSVWMAADTGEPVDGTWHGRARKIRRVTVPGAGDVLLAAAGAAGIMAVAQAWLASSEAKNSKALHPSHHDGDLDAWADAVAHLLTRAVAETVPPITEPDRDGMTVTSGTWLLGYRGRIWHLLTHHALPVQDGVAALGVGADVALGFMLGAASCAGLPSDVVHDAVVHACQRIPFCSAPDGPQSEVLDAPRPHPQKTS